MEPAQLIKQHGEGTPVGAINPLEMFEAKDRDEFNDIYIYQELAFVWTSPLDTSVLLEFGTGIGISGKVTYCGCRLMLVFPGLGGHFKRRTWLPELLL